MADYDAISQARSEANDTIVSARLTGMPPGFIVGYEPTLDTNYQITVSSGTATVFGSEVRISESTQLTDSMFDGTKLGPYWYYIYLSRSGDFHMTRSVPQLDDSLHYYRHPLNEWRAIGRLWVSDGGSSVLANEIIYVQQDVANVDNQVVIAASNTASQAKAQYRGNGSDDHVFFKCACQYLSEVFSGGRVVFTEGTFTGSAKFHCPYSNITVQGEGYSTLIKRGDSTTGASEYVFQFEGTAGTHLTSPILSEVRIDGRDLTYGAVLYVLYADSARVNNVWITGAGDVSWTGFWLSSSDNAVVDGITVEDFDRIGLWALGATAPIISNCTITSGATFAGAAAGVAISASPNAQLNNIVTTSAGSHATSTTYGFLIDGSSDSILTNCTVTSVSNAGAGEAHGFDLRNTANRTRLIGCVVGTASAGGDGIGYATSLNSDYAAIVACTVDTADVGFEIDATSDYTMVHNCSEGTTTTEITDNGTNSIVTCNSWQMTGGVLTFPMGVSLAGAVNVVGNFSVNTNKFFVNGSTGLVGIGTVTPGATFQIHRAAGDDPFFYMSDGDLTHGITDISPTDVFFQVVPWSATKGGVWLSGLSADSSTEPFISLGVIGGTSLSVPAMSWRVGKKSGAGVVSLEATDLAYRFYNWNGSAYYLSILGSGNVSMTAELAVTGNFSVNTDKLTVAAATGNTAVAGTLGVTGVATFTGAAIIKSGDDGFYFGRAAGDVPVISPIVNGTQYDGAQLYYDLGNTRWVFEEGLLVAGTLGVTGATATITNATPAFRLIDTNNSELHRFASANAGVIISADENSVSAGSYIALSVDGSEVMRAQGGGNVGIGTSSPTSALFVQPVSASAVPGIKTYTGGHTADIATFAAGAGLELICYQSDAASPYLKSSAIIANGDGTVPSELQFWTKTNGAASPVERMRIDTSGNVGIGTTAPVDVLTITPSATDKGLSIDGGTNVVAQLQKDGASDGILRLYDDSSGVENVRLRGRDATDNFILGNLGIGTASPSYKLSVIGGDIFIENNEQILQKDSGGTVRNLIYVNSSDVLTIGGTYADTYFPGNVGIGTASPNQKLTVEGTMSLKEQAAAGADVAAYGQIWVKNDTPNTLWFTDDAGTDHQIAFV